ncbi:MAG: NADH-quinone oxidoreductase subunit NuoE [Pseudomonadota bacterium]
MAVRRLAAEQPDDFSFSADNLAWANAQIGKYPEGRQASAVIPLLWRAQEQEGWVSEPVIRVVADMLDMAYIRVLEVATFYTMFQLSPVGSTAHIQVCGTTPCMLRGSDDIIAVCKRRIAETSHTLSADGRFSWEEVECLGACVNAPMVQMVRETYEDLTAESFEALLDTWENGKTPKTGPQIDRVFSAPSCGMTSLTDPGLYDGSIPEQMRVDIGAEPKPETEAPADKPAAPHKAEKPAAPAKPGKPATTAKPVAAEKPAPSAPAATKASASAPPERGLDEGNRPSALDAPDGQADDLKKIKGIGPKIEGTLNTLGIYHFRQIAAWTAENKEWVDGYLKFKGRIDREDWINQASALAGGDETEFSKRVDAGDVPTSS